MSTIKKTTEDGWDCAPSLGTTARVVDEFGHLFYEIRNSVRVMSTEDMLAELRYFVESLDEAVGNAENKLDGVEFETVDDED
ncbi:MAG: hypothetical protein CMI60_19545 [Parvibaculum sp.]|nr:hypothetical protein [Parvibaculum sp.]